MKKGRYRKAIFFVVYHLEDKVPMYAIQKRKLHWRGYEFPKGGVDGFERKKTALRREVSEEIGLKIIKMKDHKLKGKYLYKTEFPDRPGIIGQTFHLFSVQVSKGKIKTDKKEHFSSKWLPYVEAKKIITHKNQKDCLKVVNSWLESVTKKIN